MLGGYRRHGGTAEPDVAATEYALVVALIAVLLISAVAAVGTSVRKVFKNSCRAVAIATHTVGPC